MPLKSLLACAVVALFSLGLGACASGKKLNEAEYDGWVKEQNDNSFQGKLANP
jgi:hypothetical protein